MLDLRMMPEYEVWWRVSEVNESQTSYSVEQADIFQYQSYSHSDGLFIILKSNITNLAWVNKKKFIVYHIFMGIIFLNS
jgi:hypothetical protein